MEIILTLIIIWAIIGVFRVVQYQDETTFEDFTEVEAILRFTSLDLIAKFIVKSIYKTAQIIWNSVESVKKFFSKKKQKEDEGKEDIQNQ